MSKKEICKYLLGPLSNLSGYASWNRVDMPRGAKIINISVFDGKVYLHAIVDNRNNVKERWFALYMEDTFLECYDKKTSAYVGMINGSTVYHVFQVYD